MKKTKTKSIGMSLLALIVGVMLILSCTVMPMLSVERTDLLGRKSDTRITAVNVLYANSLSRENREKELKAHDYTKAFTAKLFMLSQVESLTIVAEFPLSTTEMVAKANKSLGQIKTVAVSTIALLVIALLAIGYGVFGLLGKTKKTSELVNFFGSVVGLASAIVFSIGAINIAKSIGDNATSGCSLLFALGGPIAYFVFSFLKIGTKMKKRK